MTLPYSSPSEERSGGRKKSRGGRRFYREKGQPQPTPDKPGTEYRDSVRTEDERESAALARALGELAKQYPRFEGKLFRLQHHVLIQVRSIEWKCSAVTDCLSPELMSIEELIEDSGLLDEQSTTEALKQLLVEKKAEMCNRNGDAVLIRRDGKPSEKIYWRRART